MFDSVQTTRNKEYLSSVLNRQLNFEIDEEMGEMEKLETIQNGHLSARQGRFGP